MTELDQDLKFLNKKGKESIEFAKVRKLRMILQGL